MAFEPSYKIFIRGIAPTIDENGLELAFAKYGRIMEVLLLRDKETKASRGMGFITFECTEDCEDAIRGMNGQELKGSLLSVELATEKPGSQNFSRGRGLVSRGGQRGVQGCVPTRGQYASPPGRPFRPSHPSAHARPPFRGGHILQGGLNVLPIQNQMRRLPEVVTYEESSYPVPGEHYGHEIQAQSDPLSREYMALDNPKYDYDRREGPEGNNGQGQSRSNDLGPRRQDRGYQQELSPRYLSQNPPRAEKGYNPNSSYNHMDPQSYEAGYGLVDIKATESGYLPRDDQGVDNRDYSRLSYDEFKDYQESTAPEWNREYGLPSFSANSDRKLQTSQGYGQEDTNRYGGVESRAFEGDYDLGSSMGYGMVHSRDHDSRQSAGVLDTAQSDERYLCDSAPRLAPERDYRGSQRATDHDMRYDVADSRTENKSGARGGLDHGYGLLNAHELEYKSADRDYRTTRDDRLLTGPSMKPDRMEVDTRGADRGEYRSFAETSSCRDYRVMTSRDVDTWRGKCMDADQRSYSYPDQHHPSPGFGQEDAYGYKDRREQRNFPPGKRGYPEDIEVYNAGNSSYADPSQNHTQATREGGYGSASEGFSGGRPARGLVRNPRGHEISRACPPPRSNPDNLFAKRRHEPLQPEPQRNYKASHGRMSSRGSRRPAHR